LNKSGLELNFTVAAIADRYTIMRTGNFAPIESIELKTATSQQLIDLRNVGHYTQCVLRPQNSAKEFLSMPQHDTGNPTTLANCRLTGQLFGPAGQVQNSDHYSSAGIAAQSVNVSMNNVKHNNGTVLVNAADGKGIEYSASEVPTQNFVRSGSVNTDLAVRCWIPFSLFPHTLFQCNKDMYWNENLFLTITFANGSDWGFVCRQNAVVGNQLYNAAGPVLLRLPEDVSMDFTIAGSEILTSVPVLSSCVVHLAVEQDMAIAEAVKSRVMNTEQGIKFTTPFVRSYYANFANANKHTFQQRLTIADGRKLRHVYVCPFNGTQSGSLRFQNYNHGQLLWSDVRTLLNTKPHWIVTGKHKHDVIYGHQQ
jgi:hypothetical protein